MRQLAFDELLVAGFDLAQIAEAIGHHAEGLFPPLFSRQVAQGVEALQACVRLICQSLARASSSTHSPGTS